jgi:hypothetical protein
MDTKPHREFKFSQILDALEYDLPPNRQIPAAPPLTSSSVPSTMSDERDVSRKSHTFKIVTTKRTLLLCAPSEEEEIKWLSAICALIARRKDLGVVPGESQPGSCVPLPAPHGGTVEGASGIGSGISGGIKGKGRRLSASGLSGITGVIEGAPESQSRIR